MLYYGDGTFYKKLNFLNNLETGRDIQTKLCSWEHLTQDIFYKESSIFLFISGVEM